jgi:hypothetical protein
MDIEIAPAFRACLAEAVIRFRYLHPDVRVTVRENAVSLDVADTTVAAEFRYVLYRQRILHESMDIRHALIAGVLG